MSKRVATFSAAVLALALFAGCGGDGSAKTQETLPPDTVAPASTDNLAMLVANAGKQRYKITYTDQGAVGQTYAQDGKGNSVQIIGNSQVFVMKQSTITCEGTDGAFECTKSPRSATDAGNPLLGVATLLQTQLDALGGNVGNRSDRVIAGRDAQCITFAAKDLVPPGENEDQTIPAELLNSKASYSYCIDLNTGVTLEVSGTTDSGEPTTTLEVSNFEAPSPSDFVPPATPS